MCKITPFAKQECKKFQRYIEKTEKIRDSIKNN